MLSILIKLLLFERYPFFLSTKVPQAKPLSDFDRQWVYCMIKEMFRICFTKQTIEMNFMTIWRFCARRS